MPAATRATAVAGLIALCLVWLASDVALGRQGCVTGFSPPTLNISAEGTTPGSPATSNVQTSSSTCAWKWEGSQPKRSLRCLLTALRRSHDTMPSRSLLRMPKTAFF